MIQVDFMPVSAAPEAKIGFAVIMARTACGWLFVRKKSSVTWEIPGGHREPGEAVGETAVRELYEETGACASVMEPVTAYRVTDGAKISYGVLYFAEVCIQGALPESEIAEVVCADALPEALTYPAIQPHLFMRGAEFALTWDYAMSDVF